MNEKTRERIETAEAYAVARADADRAFDLMVRGIRAHDHIVRTTDIMVRNFLDLEAMADSAFDSAVFARMADDTAREADYQAWIERKPCPAWLAPANVALLADNDRSEEFDL